jgi:hypothetical protein
MQDRMLLARQDLKVLWSIVSLVPIDVMDNFIAGQWSPQYFSHNETMLSLVSICSIRTTGQNMLVPIRADRESTSPVWALFTFSTRQATAGSHAARLKIPVANTRFVSATTSTAPNCVTTISSFKGNHNQLSEHSSDKVDTIYWQLTERCNVLAVS